MDRRQRCRRHHINRCAARRPHHDAIGRHRPTAHTSWDVNLAAFGDGGTLWHGVAPADVAAVRLLIGDTAITLPVARDDNGIAIYAIPIAPGLDLRQVELIADSGTVINKVTPPTFLTPSSGGGAFRDVPLDGTFPS